MHNNVLPNFKGCLLPLQKAGNWAINYSSLAMQVATCDCHKNYGHMFIAV